MKHIKTFESFLNEAASVPSNIMDFAKRKGPTATSLVKKAATWAEKAGKRISGGTAIGKNYSTIILDMKYQGAEIYINLDDETIELFGEEVTDAKSFKKVLDAEVNESEVNEASQPNFEVGKKYKHSRHGEFEVIELMRGQNTRVQFKKQPKGETSIIAGWGSDGYQEIKD